MRLLSRMVDFVVRLLADMGRGVRCECFALRGDCNYCNHLSIRAVEVKDSMVASALLFFPGFLYSFTQDRLADDAFLAVAQLLVVEPDFAAVFELLGARHSR